MKTLTRAQWDALDKNYKGYTHGVPHVLVLGPRGTTLEEVRIIETAEMTRRRKWNGTK